MSRSLLCLSLLFVLVLSAAAHGGGGHDDDEADADAIKPHLHSRSLILVKIWCLILVFIGTFIGGISPYFLKWNDGFLVLGTQFAGGVFLGTAMMHFLSDANETFEDLTSVEYPFAFMLACGGYLITMAADCVIYYVYRKQSDGLTMPDVEIQGNGQASKITSSAASFGDSIMLIFALCFHSVFEGIAIGIADTKANAWRALWTVSLHKVFAAVAMGIALLRMIPDRPLLSCATYAFAFAISSPIGVGIGIVIDATTQGRVADWIYAISMGIACGVFVYVSINHLLLGMACGVLSMNHLQGGHQVHKPVSLDTPYFKLMAVTLGLGVIAVVMIWD